MSAQCVHELDPPTCSWCSGRDGGEAEARARNAQLLAGGRALAAQYAGRCAGCGEHFDAGTPISTRNGFRGFRASCCLDDQGRPTR